MYTAMGTGVGTFSGSIVIQAATGDGYWAYAPTTGGLPVFDVDTGVQINPNVVID